MNNPDTQRSDIDLNLTAMAAGQAAAVAAGNYANATDAMIKGMDLFLSEWQRTGNNPNKHGNLFEFIEAAKFNAEAALKRSDLNAQVMANPTDPNLAADPHSKVDILIRRDGQTVREAQLKAHSTPAANAFHQKNPDYRGMERVVPKEHVPKVDDLATRRAETGSINAEDYRDVKANLARDGLQHENVSSGGTALDETRQAVESPHEFTAKMELAQAGKEVAATAGYAALSGAVIGGAISGVKNTMAVIRGEKSIGAAAGDIAQDSARSGAQTGVIGGTGAIIRFVCEKYLKAGLLSKANAATAMAASIINSGLIIYKYAKGEITAEDTMIQLGQTGVSTTYGLYVGAAVGAITSGPIMAAVATTAGFLIANYAYQSGVAVLKEAKLAEHEAAKVIALCKESIEQLDRLRGEFERETANEIGLREKSFDQLFAAMNQGMADGDYLKTINGLSTFAANMGLSLKLERFEKFDAFMLEGEKALTI